MPLSSDAIRRLIDRELSTVSDRRVVSHIRGILIEPYSIMRTWDYGAKGQQYPCWMVLKDTASAAEIAYCEFGFGPKCPWGLVSSGDAPANQHMGMDSGWYTSFLDAFFESYAATALPIWRVFDGGQPWPGRPLTGESTWEDTWKEVEALKKTNPNGRYFAHHSIAYGEPPVQGNC
jgi:hypothetical protein